MCSPFRRIPRANLQLKRVLTPPLYMQQLHSGSDQNFSDLVLNLKTISPSTDTKNIPSRYPTEHNQPSSGSHTCGKRCGVEYHEPPRRGRCGELYDACYGFRIISRCGRWLKGQQVQAVENSTMETVRKGEKGSIMDADRYVEDG